MISISQPLDQNCCTALDGVDPQFVYLGHSCASISNVQALFRSISCGKDTSSSWRPCSYQIWYKTLNDEAE